MTFEDGDLALAVDGDGSATGFDPATCAEVFRIEGGEGAYYAAYDGVVQAFDEEGTRLYDYAGRLVCEAGPQASFTRGENGQYILTDGPLGRGVLPHRPRRRHARGGRVAIPVPAVYAGGQGLLRIHGL